MKLSIITINLNNAYGLAKTIDSVASQSFIDYEWIIIDGGSDDGSKELIEKHSSLFTYWVSEPDNGIYHAMNKGVSKAKGDYIQFLNSGDWLCSSNILSEVFKKQLTADILYGNIQLFKNDQYVKTFCYAKNMSLLYLFRQSLGHNSSFIRRELLVASPFDERLRIASDWKFFLSAALNNKRFEYLDMVVGCFDLSGISTTNEALLSSEKSGIVKELCPACLMVDLKQKEELESFMAHTELDQFIELRKVHNILGKVLTAIVLIMKKLGK